MAKKKSKTKRDIDMRPRAYPLVTIFISLLGIIDGLILARLHYILLKQGDYESFCNISARINCDVVNLSKYSELLGIPISLLGVFTYLVIISLSLIELRGKNRFSSHTPVYVYLITVWCILYSIFLICLLVFVIKTVCIQCAFLYLVHIALFIITQISIKVPMRKIPSVILSDLASIYKNKPAFVGCLVAAVVFICIPVHLYKEKGLFLDIEVDEIKYTIHGELYEGIDEFGHPMLGGKGAEITIVEFTDFQCPYCAKGAAVARQMVERYDGSVNLVFRHFPMDQKCMELKRPFHRHACDAAVASECANLQGLFWDYHNILFRNQRNIKSVNLREWAREVGLNVNEFLKCMNEGEAMDLVLDDIAEAQKLGVYSTPTFFVNGQKITGYIPEDTFASIIEEKLAQEKE